MYKFKHRLLPAVFDNYFQKPSHDHNTRYATSSDNFEVMRISTNKDKSLLKYIGPLAWIDIPSEIKQAPSLKVFIKSYRINLIGNYDPP